MLGPTDRSARLWYSAYWRAVLGSRLVRICRAGSAVRNVERVTLMPLQAAQGPARAVAAVLSCAWACPGPLSVWNADICSHTLLSHKNDGINKKKS